MKFLKTLALFLFVINSYSQVKKIDSIRLTTFFNETNYKNKIILFKKIILNNSSIKTTEEWVNFFNNEETKYNNKNNSSALYYITLCKSFLYINDKNYEKSNEIIYTYYYKYKNVANKNNLCKLLRILTKNSIKMNKTSELIIIKKEKLEVCPPNPITFYEVYSKLGFLDLAIKNFKENDFYEEDIEDFQNGKNQNNIGVFYKREKKYDSAFYYFNKSLKILEKVKKEDSIEKKSLINFWLGLVKGNLGECYIEFKNYDKAIELFRIEEKESRIFYKNKNWPYEDDYFRNITACLLNTGRHNLAKKYIDSLYFNKNIYLYTKLKSEYFDITKKYDSANHYNKLFIRTSDSITKINKQELNISILKLIDFKEELTTQKFKILEVVKDNKLKNRELIIISIILVFLTLFIVTLIHLIYKKNKQKKIIENQNDAINKSLLEKNALLRELHHRVKNNFQIMISILNLQLQKIKNKEFKNTFQYSINRVTTIARIHDKLLKNDSLYRIPLYNYIEDIIGDLKIIYNSLHGISIEVNIDSKILIYIDQTQALGLITNELITNSYKYAFSKKTNNIISLTIKEKEGVIYFDYSDNGTGFDLNKVDQNNSIGITLIQRLVNQLGTTAHIDPKDGMKISFSFVNNLDN